MEIVVDIFSDLEEAFKHIKYYFQDFKIPHIYTTISAFGNYGFGNDITITENYIIIGLDFFPGRESKIQSHYYQNTYLKDIKKNT